MINSHQAGVVAGSKCSKHVRVCCGKRKPRFSILDMRNIRGPNIVMSSHTSTKKFKDGTITTAKFSAQLALPSSLSAFTTHGSTF